MSRELKLTAFFYFSSFAFSIYRTSLETATIAVVGLLLVAMVIYLERDKETKTAELEEKIRLLNQRVDGLSLAQGMGR